MFYPVILRNNRKIISCSNIINQIFPCLQDFTNLLCQYNCCTTRKKTHKTRTFGTTRSFNRGSHYEEQYEQNHSYCCLASGDLPNHPCLIENKLFLRWCGQEQRGQSFHVCVCNQRMNLFRINDCEQRIGSKYTCSSFDLLRWYRLLGQDTCIYMYYLNVHNHAWKAGCGMFRRQCSVIKYSHLM